MSQNTVSANVFAARKFKSKAGNDSFQQDIEILQAGKPSCSYARFANDEKYVLAPGRYTATASFYRKTFQLADGKAAFETIVSFSDFALVK